MGEWSNVYRWFQDLRTRPVPGDVLSALDDTRELKFRTRMTEGSEQEHFFGNPPYTEKSLFLVIAERLRQRPAIRDLNLPDAELSRRLWDVLRGFEFDGLRTRDQIISDLDSLLRAIVDNKDDIPRIRNNLAWALMERASHGNVPIAASEFLAEHGLQAMPLTDWAGIRERARVELSASLRRLRYDASLDVRTALASRLSADWQRFPARVLVITGESGQGKTWLLAALARDAASGAAPVVLTEATEDYAQDTQAAADTFWLNVRRSSGETSIPLRQVADRLGEVVPMDEPVRLRLCFDKVNSWEEAVALVREGWPSRGVGIAMTCPSPLARSLHEAFKSEVEIVPCEDFTWPELHDLLQRRLASQWTSVPNDVQETLRRPLLASIFCDEFAGGTVCPTNEYELYGLVWRRLSTGAQTAFPLDALRLEALAADVLQGAPYPWTAQQMGARDVDNACICRLEACGWLVRTKDARFRAFHDRLVNWAVAQSLFSALRTQPQEIADIAKQVADIARQEGKPGGVNLGYVPLDLLWLITGEEALRATCGTALLAALEPTFTHPAHVLYSRLVPTLGARVAECVFRRFRDSAVPEWELGAMAVCLAGVGRDRIGEFAGALLETAEPRMELRALMLLRQVPYPSLLDRMWQVHLRIANDPKRFGEEPARSYLLRNSSFETLKASAKQSPEWIVHKIRTADPFQEPVADLAWLVASLSDRGATWRKCKPDLLAKVPPDKRSVLATCIGRFRDASEIGTLHRYLNEHSDWRGLDALRALARLDAGAALTALNKLDPPALAMARTGCLAEVFHRHPTETHAAILERMRQVDDPWSFGSIFTSAENDLTPNELSVLLNALDTRLARLLDASADVPACALSRELEFLASLQSPVLLDVLQTRRGTSFEQRLSDYLRRIGPRHGRSWHNLDVEPGVKVLHHMGGKGFTAVVNDYLTSDSPHGRLDAIGLAPLRPDDKTLEALAQISVREEQWDGKFPLEQIKAMDVLAFGEKWESVARGLERWDGTATIELVCHRLVPLDFRASWVDVLRARVMASPTAGNVIALGFAGTKDDVNTVHRVLAQCAAESPLALACIQALILLEDDSDEGVGVVAPQLRIKEHRHVAKWMLARVGSDAAWNALLAELQLRFDATDAVNLINLSQQVEVVVPIAIKALCETDSLGASLNTWGALDTLFRHIRSPEIKTRLLADTRLRDTLHRMCSADEGAFWIVGSKSSAISCLAQVEPKTAFEAAQGCLQAVDAHDRERYPYLLMEIDSITAATWLIDHMDHERSWSVRFAIARALSETDFSTHLTGRFEAENAETRASACFLASWLPSAASFEPTVRHGLDDAEGIVVQAAMDALDRLRQRAICYELAQRLQAAPDLSAKWVYLDALIDAVDPGDEFRPWPPILSTVAEGLHPFVRRWVGDRVKSRRKGLADELKRRTSP